jgi:hypothetical protein
MGIVFLEGFEDYGPAGTTGTQLRDRLSRYWGNPDTTTGSPDSQIVAGRGGGLACYLGYYQNEMCILIDKTDELICGFAFKAEGFGTLCNFSYSTPLQEQAYLSVSASGNLYVRDTSGVAYGGTSNAPIKFGVWHYVEMRVKIGTVDGEVEVWLNGEQVINLTGLDTDNGNANIHRVFFDTGTNVSTYYDDIYLVDPNKSGISTFLGPINIKPIRPIADTAEADFTPSTGVDHYAMVDDETPTLSENLSASTLNDFDLWDYGNVDTDAQSIEAIQIRTACRSDGTAISYAPVCKSGGTEYDQTTKGVVDPSIMYCRSDVLETNPNTSTAWTPTTLNAAQFGVKRK